MATVIRLVEQVINGETRVRLLEVTRFNKLQPLALYNLKNEAEIRAYVEEMNKALAEPVLDGREMEFL